MTLIPREVLAEQWFGFMHEVIGRVQKAFRDSGLTQKQLNDRLGKGTAFISRCLSGQQNMTMRTLYELARAMGYRLEITLRPLSELRPANLQPTTSDSGIRPSVAPIMYATGHGSTGTMSIPRQ